MPSSSWDTWFPGALSVPLVDVAARLTAAYGGAGASHLTPAQAEQVLRVTLPKWSSGDMRRLAEGGDDARLSLITKKDYEHWLCRLGPEPAALATAADLLAPPPQGVDCPTGLAPVAWYHGDVARDELAASLSPGAAPVGSFLIRLSSTEVSCFTVSMLYAGAGSSPEAARPCIHHTRVMREITGPATGAFRVEHEAAHYARLSDILVAKAAVLVHPVKRQGLAALAAAKPCSAAQAPQHTRAPVPQSAPALPAAVPSHTAAAVSVASVPASDPTTSGAASSAGTFEGVSQRRAESTLGRGVTSRLLRLATNYSSLLAEPKLSELEAGLAAAARAGAGSSGAVSSAVKSRLLPLARSAGEAGYGWAGAAAGDARQRWPLSGAAAFAAAALLYLAAEEWEATSKMLLNTGAALHAHYEWVAAGGGDGAGGQAKPPPLLRRQGSTSSNVESNEAGAGAWVPDPLTTLYHTPHSLLEESTLLFKAVVIAAGKLQPPPTLASGPDTGKLFTSHAYNGLYLCLIAAVALAGPGSATAAGLLAEAAETVAAHLRLLGGSAAAAGALASNPSTFATLEARKATVARLQAGGI